MPQMLEEEASASPSPSILQENTNKMRIRLTVQRHKLEPVDLLWTISEDLYKSHNHTISRWLSEVDEVVPLEADEWGLEDYVVHVQGFECLHFKKTGDVFREGDHVTIRPLETVDIRARQMGGRHQISPNGITLIDGVPFGRPAVRAAMRPQVHIPPRKRRRLTYDDPGTGAINGVDDTISLSEIDGSSEQLLLVNSGEVPLEEAKNTPQLKRTTKEKKSVRFGFLPKEDTDEDDEEDGDFNPDAVDGESLGDSSETSSSDDEMSDAATSSCDSESSSGEDSDSDSVEPDAEKKMSETTKPVYGKSEQKKESQVNGTEQNKSTKSHMKYGLGGLDGTMESEEDGGRPPKRPVSPGHGLHKTQKRNQRRRITNKLRDLIAEGQLPPNSTKAEYIDWLERNDENLQTYNTGEPSDGTRSNKRFATHHTQSENGLAKRQESILSSASEAIDEAPARQASTATDEEVLAEELPRKRQRRNVDIANRLIFGSLGQRVPKTKEERDIAREKLSNVKGSTKGMYRATPTPTPDPPASIPNAGDVQVPGVPNAIPNAEEMSVLGAWREKIILSAVECCEDGVVLSTPPFPFAQRWDSQQQSQKQLNQEHRQGRKRKRQGREQYGREGYDQEANEDEYYEANGSPTMLDYDEETTNLDSSILQGEVENQIMNDIAAANDLPLLPTTLDHLHPLMLADIVPGAIIAYKELEVSAATSWAPAISAYKTAMVVKDDELSGSTFKVQLALRDRIQPKYNDKGERVFEKFEMVTDEHDDGLRELRFEELYEPRIVSAAKVAGDEETVQI